MAFLGQMACSYQCPEQLQFVPGLWSKKSQISSDLQKYNLFADNPIPSNSRDNMKSQIKNKSFNCGITITNIKRKQQVSILTCVTGQGRFMSNHNKINSLASQLHYTVANYYILSDISSTDIRPQILNSRPRILISGQGFKFGLEDQSAILGRSSWNQISG